MSKSQGNYIALNDAPAEMYGKVMSLPDHVMLDYFTLVTDVPAREIEEMREQMESRAVNPMEVKKRLAREIVSELHGQGAAQEAEHRFETVIRGGVTEMVGMGEAITAILAAPGGKVQRRMLADGTVELVIPFSHPVGIEMPALIMKKSGPGYDLAGILLYTELVKSRSEAVRLIREGAIDVDGKAHREMHLTVRELRAGTVIVVRVGKHRFLRIVDADKQE
jgi:tyrosyl-tRNA synthetase